MERIYDAKRCGDENRLTFTEYLLIGEAGHWWGSSKMLLEDKHTPITWEVFKKKFYEEYFPNSVRFAKEVEFLQLVQGGMTVSEYANRFKQLMRFYTMRMSEERQCRKFENRLREDLKPVIASHCIQKFPALVERAKVLEKNLMDAERRKKQQQPSSKGPIFSRTNPGPRATPYSRPMSSSGPSALAARPVNYARPSGQPGSVNCFICGGPHFMKDCPKQGNAKYCVRCRRNGHWERECNMGDKAFSRPPNTGRFQQSGGRAQAAGRVYAIIGAEASSVGNLITSTCLLHGMPCCVLFDSGATHSFISKACVNRLGLTERELQLDLVVSTPAAGEVRTSTVCVRCPIEVEGYKFKVNLICLPLQDLEVIPGMDWLASNHILIDCGKKQLIFPKEEEKFTLTLDQIREDLIEGAMSFLILTYMDASETDRPVGDHSVIDEFLDAFPEEVPGLPPPREVEFSIDFISGAGPISIAPYRMAPAELAKLKKQIEELLEKKFIRQVHHLGELQCCWSKRRMAALDSTLTTGS
ncbi:uncharacterized protein LOC111240490 [Vigna radiata var. radiata]|uniref:Uncharacterized protein LOC111240490 n=1 Tax=Vigna radiata var. radiata TaxID=3916 RepID=A0A3Q0F5P7_VIGRR|nr:uncharacterized protein LOC111240490 [Vigna radiata var. radiata]